MLENCRNCGAVLPEGAAFCRRCGAPLREGGASFTETDADFAAAGITVASPFLPPQEGEDIERFRLVRQPEPPGETARPLSPPPERPISLPAPAPVSRWEDEAPYAPPAPREDEPERTAVVSAGGFFWTSFLFLIPAIGFFAALGMACSSRLNRNLRAYARAALVWQIIALVLGAIGVVMFLSVWELAEGDPAELWRPAQSVLPLD